MPATSGASGGPHGVATSVKDIECGSRRGGDEENDGEYELN